MGPSPESLCVQKRPGLRREATRPLLSLIRLSSSAASWTGSAGSRGKGVEAAVSPLRVSVAMSRRRVASEVWQAGVGAATSSSSASVTTTVLFFINAFTVTFLQTSGIEYHLRTADIFTRRAGRRVRARATEPPSFRVKKMRPKNVGLILFALLLLCPAVARAQQKLLTIDDIYDPEKKVSFSGTAVSGLEWLKDGEHYLQSRKQGDADVLMRVNARTGEAAPFFDAARMEAALAKIQGVSAKEAKSLAHQESYKLNGAQTAVLLKAAHDLV